MNGREKYARLLREQAFKVTTPRIKILETLDSANVPLTANEIHTKLEDLGADIATVYRCLNKFVDAGLIRRVDFGDEFTRFELAGDSHHHHIICTKCSRVEEIRMCNFETLAKHITEASGFHVLSHEVIYRGLCPDCIKKYGLEDEED